MYSSLASTYRIFLLCIVNTLVRSRSFMRHVKNQIDQLTVLIFQILIGLRILVKQGRRFNLPIADRYSTVQKLIEIYLGNRLSFPEYRACMYALRNTRLCISILYNCQLYNLIQLTFSRLSEDCCSIQQD